MHLPDDLMAEKRWLVWREEDGRKVPYYPTTHRRRSGTMETAQDFAAMGSHADAMESLKSHVPHYTGLGYAITNGNLLIDLDDVLNEHGEFIDDWAEKFTYKAIASGAFVEVSHSGTGIHVIGKVMHVKLAQRELRSKCIPTSVSSPSLANSCRTPSAQTQSPT